MTFNKKTVFANFNVLIFGLLALVVLMTGCKKDPIPPKDPSEGCKTPVEKSIKVTDIRDRTKLYIPSSQLEFLSTPDLVLSEVEGVVTFKGSIRDPSKITLALNGIKVGRKDGYSSVELVSYDPKKNRSTIKFKLHKMFVNGDEPFDKFLAKLRKNKGVLKITFYNCYETEIVEAILTFRGDIQNMCPPPPPPPPAPISKAQIDSTAPSESPTRIDSISISFSSRPMGSSYWCSLDGAVAKMCSSPQAYSQLVSGDHKFTVYAVNSEGVAGPAAQYKWTVDNVPPDVTITNISELPQQTKNADIEFKFTSNKPGSTFKCALDGKTLTECQSPTRYSGLTDGAHVFAVFAVDKLGNISLAPATYQWTVDLVAPQTQFVNVVPAGAINNVTTKEFAFVANESATFECSVDNGSFFACQSPYKVSGLSEGSHWFEVRATDVVGNLGLPVSYSWTVDTTPPQIILGAVAPQVGVPSNANLISTEFTTNEPAVILCSFDQKAAVACVSPFIEMSVDEGVHQLTVVAVDTAGNQSLPLTLDWMIDHTSPLISFGKILPSMSLYLNSDEISLEVNASERSELIVQVNGVNVKQNSSPVKLNRLTEGFYEVSVAARDSAGNLSNTIKHEFNVDLTAPLVKLTPSNTDKLTNSDRNSFEFTASEASTFECQLDSVGFAACVSPTLYSGLADGMHEFEVRGRDLAGNVSAIVKYSWTVDTTPPKTTVVARQQGSDYSFDLTSSEPNSTFECSMDATVWAVCQSGVSYSGLSEGRHVFVARAIDAVGNLDLIGAKYEFEVALPIGTVFDMINPPDLVTMNTEKEFSFHAIRKPASRFLCAFDGGPATVCTPPLFYSDLNAGTHTLVVRAVDMSGNVDPVGATHTWTIDQSPPVFSELRATATADTITVTWVSDKPTTSKVEYGVAFNINQSTPEIMTYVTDHSMVITGVTSSTTYILQVFGRDLVGHEMTSSQIAVRTPRQ